jgi:hypothetical protein
VRVPGGGVFAVASDFLVEASAILASTRASRSSNVRCIISLPEMSSSSGVVVGAGFLSLVREVGTEACSTCGANSSPARETYIGDSREDIDELRLAVVELCA